MKEASIEVMADQATVADDVGAEDGGKPSFHGRAHWHAPGAIAKTLGISRMSVHRALTQA